MTAPRAESTLQRENARLRKELLRVGVKVDCTGEGWFCRCLGCKGKTPLLGRRYPAKAKHLLLIEHAPGCLIGRIAEEQL